MTSTSKLVVTHLTPLIGLQLTIGRRAGNMTNFHFGKIRRFKDGTKGAYALHIQCPWRIEDRRRIVTGRADLYEPADPTGEIDLDDWHFETHENLLYKRIRELLGGYDPETRSAINVGAGLVVERVACDRFGTSEDFTVRRIQALRISRRKRGRVLAFFQCGNTSKHFVWEDGNLED
jgi:hypothetical protein